MSADRILTLSRFIAAPPAKVWTAWTDPTLLPRWFGPEGFSCRTKDIDLRQGGQWRFDMIGPDSKVWPNRHRYLVMEPQTRIVFLMDDDGDAHPPSEVTVTLEAQGGGTRIAQVILFPDVATREAAEGFGAVELGKTTLAKLAALVEG
ncbi:MAG: hypothetical protein DI533_15105 [Cereibacter sphaeroides]|uniref:Activator of Hsp90 ATPase homologue 1/2-like C-terminal domain-containing protein n=1 Tax=Cereibacter sphaeroides TaxID=1063 RepID=A0A2W5S1V9_CERSP|nr:MAG: hypothetical protein DI533_15105 [Cereibacter sphaeroides]